MMARKKFYMNDTKTFIVLRSTEWSLQVNRVTTKDKRQMVLVKPVRSTYDQDEKRFSYEDIEKPIWLSLAEAADFFKVLVEMTDGNVEVENESAQLLL